MARKQKARYYKAWVGDCSDCEHDRLEQADAFTVEIIVKIIKADGSIEYSYRTAVQDADERATIFHDRASADQQVRSIVLKLRKIVQGVRDGL